MGKEIFESYTISLIITWVSIIPVLFGILNLIIGWFYEAKEEPIYFKIWLFICVILLSPFRYAVLQGLMLIAYPFQSLSAFFTSSLLVMYVPLIFIVISAIGIALPLYLTYYISGLSFKVTNTRRALASLIAPFIFTAFSFLYFSILPYAGYSVQWVHPKNIIRSANGPASFYYDYVIDDLTPLEFSGFVREVGFNEMNSKERLRAHIATVYLSDKGHNYYIRECYPEILKKSESKKTKL